MLNLKGELKPVAGELFTAFVGNLIGSPPNLQAEVVLERLL
jgi:hypothetical protein